VDKDQIKPFHAKETSTGQETADILSEVLKHAAARDIAANKKIAAKPQPIWMLPLGLTLSVFAGFLWVAPPSWVVVNEIAAQAPEDQMQNVRAAILLYGQRVETYLITYGRLPQTLAEAGVTVTGIDYTLQGGGYVLIASVGETDVVFNSTVESLREWGLREVRDLEIGG
jgi:hypothetical protein